MAVPWSRNVCRALLCLPACALSGVLALVGAVGSLCLCCYCAVQRPRNAVPSSDEWKAEEDPVSSSVRPPKRRLDIRSVPYKNFYHVAADGTRLAVDVWLPPGVDFYGAQGRRVGCILHQARYYRSLQLW
jgi:hypothetical protein